MLDEKQLNFVNHILINQDLNFEKFPNIYVYRIN